MKEATGLCEETLAGRLADDLDGSFEALVRLFQDRLYGFALRITGNSRDAEEAAQDAFVRAYRAMSSYPAERTRALALRSWLYQITLNVCRNRVRRKQVAVVPLDSGEEDEGDGLEVPADPAEQPEVLFELSETRTRLADLLLALPEKYRVAVVLRFVQDLSYAEAAAVLGQPVGTVKANVHRGIRLLRASMPDLERVAIGGWGGTNER